MNHKQDITDKLNIELKELSSRIKAIKKMLHINAIKIEDPKLLRKQLGIMKAYEEILKKRIESIEQVNNP